MNDVTLIIFGILRSHSLQLGLKNCKRYIYSYLENEGT